MLSDAGHRIDIAVVGYSAGNGNITVIGTKGIVGGIHVGHLNGFAG